MDELRGRRLGGFELVEELGAGAFASVWRARQLRLGRDVAVKVLDPGLARTPDAARRFEREGRSAAALDHPNIVPVYEAGEEDGIVYLAMRLVPGTTLADELALNGPPGRSRTLAIVGAVAAALDHAHAHGLIHRDVKPSNILLEGDRVWLADFGIAASARDLGQYTAGAIGTAGYMAPEQARGGADVDHRADLYSLGCVVYELVVGRAPFAGDDLIQTLLAHASAPVPPTGISGLDAFLGRALAKDPGDRFASGAALAEALTGALPDDGSGQGTPPPAGGGADATRPLPASGGGDTAPAVGEVAPAAGSAARASRSPRTVLAVVASVVVLGAAATATGLARGGEGRDNTSSTTAPGAAAPPAVVNGGTAVVAMFTEPFDEINPHRRRAAEQLATGIVLPPMYALDADNAWAPHLAGGDPEVLSTDPLVFRFTIDPAAVWDDGTPITSADVERTLTYMNDPASKVALRTLHDRIGRLDRVDDRTFTVTMREPLGEPRLLFSTIHPVIKKASLDAYLAGGGDPATYLDGPFDFSGGPFRLVGFEPNQEVGLVRNERWWGPRPKLDRITVRFHGDRSAAIDAVARNEADIATIAAPLNDDLLRAEALPGVSATLLPDVAQYGLQFNTGAAPFDDERVRRAFASALDRRALAEAIVPGDAAAAPPGSLVFFPGQPGYADRLSAIRRDGTAAGALLDEAGWVRPDGSGTRARDGVPLRVTIDVAGITNHAERIAALAQLVAEQLRAVGVDVVLEQRSGAAVAELWTTGRFQATVSLTIMSPDPLVAVELYSGRRCPRTVPGCTAATGFNYWKYDNAAVTDLLERTNTTYEPEVRRSLFEQADAALAIDLPTLPLVQPPALVLARDALGAVAVPTQRVGPLAGIAAWGYKAA